MRRNASPEALLAAWEAGFPGQIPHKLVIAEELERNVVDLEGHELVVVEIGHTDADHTTCLHVPSMGLVVAGDAAYNDVHLYLAESDPQTRKEWIAALHYHRVARAACGGRDTQTAGERRRSPDHRRDAAVHPRFRSAGANDQHRSRTLRPDAGVVSEPDQSRVGAMELRARRQSLTSFPPTLSQPQGFPWKATKRSHYAF